MNICLDLIGYYRSPKILISDFKLTKPKPKYNLVWFDFLQSFHTNQIRIYVYDLVHSFSTQTDQTNHMIPLKAVIG